MEKSRKADHLGRTKGLYGGYGLPFTLAQAAGKVSGTQTETDPPFTGKHPSPHSSRRTVCG